MLRNLNLGVGRRDTALFVGGTILALGLTALWDLLLVEPITAAFPNNAQVVTKYLLTAMIIALAGAITLVSLVLARRQGAGAERRGMIAGFLIRFGLALQIFGIFIVPIGLIYSTNPTRSVPVGFAAFTAVFLGLFVAGIGGNMVAPRRV